MIGEEREAREDCLHRWVADGKVEWRNAPSSSGYDYLTEYRVVGGHIWRADRNHPGQFPTEGLIAALALDMLVFQPSLKPITPNWAAAWGLEFPRRSAIVCDGATT